MIVSFIINGNEITTWMGYAFKIERKNTQSNIFKIRTSLLNLKQQASDH